MVADDPTGNDQFPGNPGFACALSSVSNLSSPGTELISC